MFPGNGDFARRRYYHWLMVWRRSIHKTSRSPGWSSWKVSVMFVRKLVLVLGVAIGIANTAQAGLLGLAAGALVGGAVAHTPVGVAADAASGNTVEKQFSSHPILAMMGATAVAGYEADKHCRKMDDGGATRYICDRQINAWQHNGRFGLHARSTYKLEQAMKAAGEPKPGRGCALHHIVPQYEASTKEAAAARELLSICKIDINSSDNGVWLPDTKIETACAGRYHRNLHTAAYYRDIFERLSATHKESGCDGVRDELSEIKMWLQK